MYLMLFKSKPMKETLKIQSIAIVYIVRFMGNSLGEFEASNF